MIMQTEQLQALPQGAFLFSDESQGLSTALRRYGCNSEKTKKNLHCELTLFFYDILMQKVLKKEMPKTR